MLVQGRVAAQEPAAQNAPAGEAAGAFAMAVDEAVAQGGLKGMAGIIAEGGQEEKDKKKLDISLCLSGISALLAQGAYHIQQAAEAADTAVDADTANAAVAAHTADAADTVITGNQMHSLTGSRAVKEEGRGQAILEGVPGAAGTFDPKVSLPKPDVSGEPAGLTKVKDSAPQEASVKETGKMAAGNAAPGPVLKAAKEKNELDQADFRNIQKPQAQSAAKAAQFVGNDPAREAVKPAPADLEGSAPVIRGMAALVKPDRENEKTVQIPAAGLAVTHKEEQAIHAEDAQSAKDAAPENAVREENAAMQVARASVHALRRGMSEYRVRLSPEGLGDVEVTVVTKGKAVTLSMRTDNEMARGLILDHADELRAELNQQDYQVSGLSVEVGTYNGNGAGFFASREHAGPEFDPGHRIPDQEAADAASDRGPQAEQKVIMPRSSTISYRI